MKARNLCPKLVFVLSAIFLTSVVVLAATTTLIVYPGNLEGWEIQIVPGSQPSPSPTPSVTFVFGPTSSPSPAPPPLGVGSVEFRVGSDGDADVEIRQSNFSGTALPNPSPDPEQGSTPAGELLGLSYSTFAQSGGSGGQTPYLILNIDNNDDGIFNLEDGDDLLFFEPVYQNGTYTVVDPSITIPNQCGGNPLCVTPGQWQTWDAFNGGWWSLNAGTFGPPLTTLKFYRSQHPTARIINSPTGLGGVRIVTGNGAPAWNNFVGNADAFSITVTDAESNPTTTVYDFEPQAPPPPPTSGASGIIITELRASGPGLGEVIGEEPGGIVGGSRGRFMGGAPPGRFGGPGGRQAALGLSDETVGVGGEAGQPGDALAPPCCDEDEYVELYNSNDFPISVQSTDGTAGIALAQRGTSCLSTPQIVAVIPNGTIIPARGHYLVAGNEYSLSDYPADNGTTATGDQGFSATLEDDRSIALFSTSDTSNFNMDTRLDAVGFDAGSGNFCDLLSEGAKLPPPRGDTSEHAYVRKFAGGAPQDTQDNASDFEIVSTTPDQPVGDDPTPVLGAPGPENTTSPLRRTNGEITESSIAPSVARSAPPNRERVTDVEPCADLGSLLIRRTFTNNTPDDVTRLRFRVIDITTFNSPGYLAGGPQADLRVRDSSDETIEVPGRGTVMVNGLTLEQPPNQPEPFCGGLNSSLSAGTITMENPLPSGGSIDVVFRFGIMQGGSFRVFVVVEALP